MIEKSLIFLNSFKVTIMQTHYAISSRLGLSEKSAIVTGAGGGIGSAITRALLDFGANVVGVDQKFAEDWPGPSHKDQQHTLSLVGDVSKTETAENTLSACLKKFGKLDILVNNAGIITGGSVLNLKMEGWKRIMDVNLGGYLNFARIAALEMTKGNQGRIVNTSSVDGIFAEPGILAYSSSKGAIIMLTKCMAIELAPHNITVNSIAPGWVDTPMGTGVLNPQQIAMVNRRIPLGHIASPDEIANAVIFLASDLSKYMTGQTIVVDGGLTSDISIPGLEYS